LLPLFRKRAEQRAAGCAGGVARLIFLITVLVGNAACSRRRGVVRTYSFVHCCLLPVLRGTYVSFRSACNFCNTCSDSAVPSCLRRMRCTKHARPLRGLAMAPYPLSPRDRSEARLQPWQPRHDLQPALDAAGQITAKRERRSPSPRLTLYGTKKTCHWHRRCGSATSKGVPPGAEVAGGLTAYGVSAFASRIGSRGRWDPPAIRHDRTIVLTR
jgi:hypothetical protein